MDLAEAMLRPLDVAEAEPIPHLLDVDAVDPLPRPFDIDAPDPMRRPVAVDRADPAHRYAHRTRTAAATPAASGVGRTTAPRQHPLLDASPRRDRRRRRAGALPHAAALCTTPLADTRRPPAPRSAAAPRH